MASNSEWLARKLLELEQQVQALGRGTRLGHSSLQGESILALDEDGEVLAELGTEGGAGGVVHLDGPEPPRPTAPVLEQGVGTIFVRWDGAWDPIDEGDEGEPPTTPIDFDRIEVHATTDPEATEWDEDTLAGSITQRNGGVVMIRGWDLDDVVYVRLVCRSLADKVSEPSEPAEVTVTGIDIAAIAEELDAANLELANLDGTMFAANAELDALRIQFKNLDTSIINTDDGTLAEALDDARQALEDVKTGAKEYTDQATDGLADAVTAAQGQADAAADAAAQASSDAAAAAQQAADAAGVAAAKGDVLIQSTTPASAMRKDTTLWIDTTDGNNTPKRWSGSAWVAVTDRATVDAANAAATAQQAADAAQSTAEAAQQAATAAGTVADQAASAAASAQQAADAAQAEAAGAASDAAAAAGIAEGKGDVLIQSSTPATAMRKATTLWIDTTGGGNTPKRWSGSAWVAVTDKVARDAATAAATAKSAADAAQSTADQAKSAAAAAQSTANEAKASADGKNRINRSTSQPPAQYDGRVDDVWWVLSSLGSGGRVLSQWRWNGTVWVSELIDSALLAYLDAAKITSGTIDAARIGAGSITADKLMIGGAQNLIPGVQPGSNRGMSEFVWDDTEKALRFDGRGTAYSDESFFLGPGEYVVEADIKASVGGTTTYVGLLGVTPAWNYRYGISNVSVSTEWQHFSATLSMPEGDEGEVRARFLPAYRGDAAATTWYRNVTFRRMTSSVLIENGAVTADKVAANAIGARAIAADAVEAGKIAADSISGREIIANAIKAEHIVAFTITAGELAANSVSTDKLVANSVIADKIASNAVTTAKLNALAVTADKIAANAVTADKIAANAITAGKIDSDAINGMVITGATVRTGDTGARVELNPSGLSAWNSAGTRTFNIDQATGQVEAVGSVYSGLPGQQRVVLDHAAFASGATYTDDNGNTVAADGAGLILGEDGDEGRRATIGFMSPATGLIRRPSLRLQGPTAFGSAFLDLGMGATLRSSSPNGSGRLSLGDGIVSTKSSGPTTIEAGSLVRLTGDNEIDLQAGGTGNSQVHMQSSRIDTTAPTSIVFGTGGGGDLALSSDSTNPLLRSRAVMNRTYSYAANMYVTTSGILGKSTSARRYKTDEREIAPAEYADELLSIPFKSWLDKGQLEQQAELKKFREDNPYCPTPEYLADVEDGPPRHVGAVAEDFIDAGLEQFVTFDQYGRVDGLQYDRIGVALIPIIKGMKEQIDRLEAANGIGE